MIRAPWRPNHFSRAHRIDIGGGPPSTISTRRFWGSRTPSGVGTRRSFSPRPVTTIAPGGTPVLRECRGYGAGSLHGQLLVVTIGARCVGVTGDLDGDRGSCPIRIGRQLDDLACARTQGGTVPIEEDEVRGRLRWCWWWWRCASNWWWWRLDARRGRQQQGKQQQAFHPFLQKLNDAAYGESARFTSAEPWPWERVTDKRPSQRWGKLTKCDALH